jgi:hypothetical protein
VLGGGKETIVEERSEFDGNDEGISLQKIRCGSTGISIGTGNGLPCRNA